MSESARSSGRPDPAEAQTAAEFVRALRRLKQWTGQGYRQLEKSAGVAGQALPRSTLTAALARDTLPRDDLVAAFVRTCGGDDSEVERWVAARRRIAAATGPDGPEPALAARVEALDPPSQAPIPESVTGRGGIGAALADLVPPAVRRGSWPIRVLVSALCAVVAITVVAAVVSTVRDLTGPTGTDPAGRGPSNPDLSASSTSTRTSPPLGGQGSEWVKVNSGENVTLADEQAIDFETGTVGSWNDKNPGFDVGLTQRADRLVAPAQPASLALLDAPGEESADRCTTTPPDRWDSNIHGFHKVKAGANICVTTGERRCVMITVDRPPDSVVAVLTFHYTTWERH
ncbi:helix-turn-helix domain-containing protein [Phytohabitans rumicis]|uniref:Uncharacterized protein n=1 Tax=Phytohabitans rumicis TaxID=1076125 RepID=A0A6V8LHN9_9ACTN|nr:helix-turn-helix domain-containing protein [Phytohabitans rumicis]GFJ93636.1 hypothetical protein Prum_072780 [Phytohabitans rumicis]